MTKGSLHDLHSGEKVGDTLDIDQAFLELVQASLEKEPVIVILGTGTPDGFADRIRALCEVVEDSRIDDAALVFAGTADEWWNLTRREGQT